MVKIRNGNIALRMRRTVVGAGVQDGQCLALAVGGREGAWRLRWGLHGRLDDADFARRLRTRVWRRPFWAPPLGSGADQDMAVCAVDLSFRDGQAGRSRPHEVKAALRIQVSGRLMQSAGPLVLHGISLKDKAAGGRHLVGAAAPRGLIDHSFRYWHREAGIINPHIGSNAAALANLYLALYPPQKRVDQPWRMLVLEGGETTHALLMNEWRLVDAIAYQMMEDQALNDVLLDSWLRFFSQHHNLDTPIEPFVIEASSSRVQLTDCEFWRPFDDAPLKADPQTGKLIEMHPQLAALAFGMALQGG